ncbi:MAG: hypothetical protein LCI00_30620 [Chloroflexi bacterium]|nr:hypothetical protein [Chloroflexota bacterium]MCC6894747.1 hypothetical protein [Anaerolineae bacterium]
MYENRSFEISYKLIRNVVLIAVVITVISVIGKASAHGMSAAEQPSVYMVEAR